MSVTTLANTSAPPPGLSVPGRDQVTEADAADSARPRARWRTVLAYLALALIALIPGVMLKLKLDVQVFGPLAEDLAEELRVGMLDVRFGFGARFWVGVSGAVMMGLLLLYPLRKVLAKRRWLASIGLWFHIHLMLGFAAPVLIIYHANFGHGDLNGNVALYAMLAVVVSGLIGHFVHASASAEFYSGKSKAIEQLDALAANLGQLNAMHAARQHFIDELRSMETELLTPRRGIIASLKARLKVEQRHRYFARSADWLIARSAHQLGMSASQSDRLLATVDGHLNAYMRIARHAASRSVREQIWARWRLFHLPAFLIMSIAMTLHIVAVWDFNVWGASTPPAIETTSVATAVSTEATTQGASQAAVPGAAIEIWPPPAASTKPAAAAQLSVSKVATIPIVPRAAKEAAPALVAKPKRVTRQLVARRPVARQPAARQPVARRPVAKQRVAGQTAKSVTPRAYRRTAEIPGVPRPVVANRPVSPIGKSPSKPAGERAKPAVTAQGASGPATTPAGARPGAFIERTDGVWVEGPGFDVTYGGTYETCSRRCLGNQRCVMIEYYRPEKKCNIYDALRPLKTGGSSNVGIRRQRP